MTEIPEHLLKRSRERRAAEGGASEGDAPAATPAVASTAATPAVAAAPAAPAKKAEPVVVPDPPYVRAHKERSKIPFWVMGTLGLLPLFAFMYWRGMTVRAEVVEGPIASGEAVFGSCATCHMPDGSGGVGRQLNNGEVLKTFPAINDMMNLIWTGSEAFSTAGLPFYGNPDREGGTHLQYNGNWMPVQSGALSELEVLEVACYIRYELSGADPAGNYATEYEQWCSPEAPVFKGFEDGSLTFESEELGIGTEPRPQVGPVTIAE